MRTGIRQISDIKSSGTRGKGTRVESLLFQLHPKEMVTNNELKCFQWFIIKNKVFQPTS